MRQFKTVVVPATTRKECTHLTCDLCGVASKNHQDWRTSWSDAAETEVRVTVRLNNGSRYPDNGSGTECEVDICPKCFQEKLIPWLKSQGADVREEEWDF